MDQVANDENVQLGDLEVWEFYNSEKGGMGMMGDGGHPHPMHIHGVQFQVLNRQIDKQNLEDYESINEGFVDVGWKDTVLVWPGERVRVLVRFDNYTGIYLYHCHNLEHEDGGMMRNYRIH
jgi:FtsP/CotA-like multicopper oxidase with cupredoxin domain